MFEPLYFRSHLPSLHQHISSRAWARGTRPSASGCSKLGLRAPPPDTAVRPAQDRPCRKIPALFCPRQSVNIFFDTLSRKKQKKTLSHFLFEKGPGLVFLHRRHSDNMDDTRNSSTQPSSECFLIVDSRMPRRVFFLLIDSAKVVSRCKRR